MSEKSTIEWTDATWNPVTGCTQVFPGCDHCYAKTFAERFRGVSGHSYAQGFDLKLWPERLHLPTTWKTPRRIFVNSMSDLLHKDIPDAFIVQVYLAMAQAPQHTYQVLTKRPSRLVHTSLLRQIIEALGGTWPVFIWLGVSVESQAYTWRVERLGELDIVPMRFVSAEPLLGPVTLDLARNGISWVIAGAESGRGARPMQEAWVRLLRDQCVAHNVALLYKQNAVRGHKLPLPALDGHVWQQFPTLLCCPACGHAVAPNQLLEVAGMTLCSFCTKPPLPREQEEGYRYV
jgi:protein gp37